MTTAPPVRTPPTMTLWRLEVLRLLRTRRWLILVGVYAVFGALGALTARYAGAIIARFGQGMTVDMPDPRPADGIAQFVGNAGQLGLLAVVVVAASALTLDAKPELAAFLRTKVARPGVLVLAPYAVTTAAAVAALAVGTALAWALTGTLLGSLPAGAVLAGTGYGAVYLAFAVAVVALVAGYTRSQAATILGALGVLLAFPILGALQPLEPWLPSRLLSAVAAMVAGAPAGEYARAALVTATATAGLLALAARRFEHREL